MHTGAGFPMCIRTVTSGSGGRWLNTVLTMLVVPTVDITTPSEELDWPSLAVAGKRTWTVQFVYIGEGSGTGQ